MKKKGKIIIWGIVLFICGGAVGWFLHKPLKMPQDIPLREDPSDYNFIDPTLLLQVPEDTTTPQLQSLKKEISDYIITATAQKKASNVSVYFRELNSDQWVGINEDELYAPASMLKVVSMIAFLREAQADPTLLDKSVTITANTDTSQDFYPPTHPAQVGQTYPAQELVDDMIIDSDNNSAMAVDALIGSNALDKTYSDLDLPNPANASDIDDYSPKMFSRFFRSLYNGAYLSDSISNQALELMSKTTFTQGLVAGVPAGTVVSHKFGERTALPPAGSTAPTIRELHDCGIVYAPGDPYLLCVMTKGTDFTSLQKIISDISSLTWETEQQLDAKK
jgi:beta-lactamase class A